MSFILRMRMTRAAANRAPFVLCRASLWRPWPDMEPLSIMATASWLCWCASASVFACLSACLLAWLSGCLAVWLSGCLLVVGFSFRRGHVVHTCTTGRRGWRQAARSICNADSWHDGVNVLGAEGGRETLRGIVRTVRSARSPFRVVVILWALSR